MNTNSKRRICFVSPNAYPLLATGGVRASGPCATEMQFLHFAHGLEQRGWQVSFITGHPAQGVTIGCPCFPVFFARLGYLDGCLSQMPSAWLDVWNAMRDADAKYYVHRIPPHLLSILSLFCRAYRRRLASWTPPIRLRTSRVGRSVGEARFLESIGLRFTDILIAQTEAHAAELRAAKMRPVHVIPNIAGRLSSHPGGMRDAFLCDVLWIGNASFLKRPGVVVELARQIPEHQIAMVMDGTCESEFVRWQASVAFVPNLRFLGSISPDEIERWIGRTRLLLDTSDGIGFPNTFLQAWMNGIPVVSLCNDPDGMIHSHGLGRMAPVEDVVAAGASALKLALTLVPIVRELLTDQKLYDEIGARALAHVRIRHAPAVTVPALEQALFSCD